MKTKIRTVTYFSTIEEQISLCPYDVVRFCWEIPFSLYPPTYSLNAFLVFPIKYP